MPKSTKQVAKEKGVDPSTVRRWAKKGKVRAAKTGGHDWIVSSSGSAKRAPQGRKKGSKRRKKR